MGAAKRIVEDGIPGATVDHAPAALVQETMMVAAEEDAVLERGLAASTPGRRPRALLAARTAGPGLRIRASEKAVNGNWGQVHGHSGGEMRVVAPMGPGSRSSGPTTRPCKPKRYRGNASGPQGPAAAGHPLLPPSPPPGRDRRSPRTLDPRRASRVTAHLPDWSNLRLSNLRLSHLRLSILPTLPLSLPHSHGLGFHPAAPPARKPHAPMTTTTILP
ncbi:hypothetical protein BH23GEM11_BH23GEM11_11270 [soil metagenome]